MPCACVALLGLLAVTATPVSAQAPRVVFGAGGMLNGPVSAGQTSATLLDPAGGGLTLFRTTNRIASGVGAEGLVSVRLAERWRVELGFGWGKAEFESRISDDFEGVPSLSATQALNQYSADIALARRVMQRRRMDVFLRGGVGGYRDITSDRALAENGWRASLGGVAQFWLRQAPSGMFGQVAVRTEARVQVRQGGIAFGDTGLRVAPVLFAGVVIGR